MCPCKGAHQGSIRQTAWTQDQVIEPFSLHTSVASAWLLEENSVILLPHEATIQQTACDSHDIRQSNHSFRPHLASEWLLEKPLHHVAWLHTGIRSFTHTDTRAILLADAQQQGSRSASLVFTSTPASGYLQSCQPPSEHPSECLTATTSGNRTILFVHI